MVGCCRKYLKENPHRELLARTDTRAGNTGSDSFHRCRSFFHANRWEERTIRGADAESLVQFQWIRFPGETNVAGTTQPLHSETSQDDVHRSPRRELARKSRRGANWLCKYPNVFVEFGARAAELGRQPRRAGKFFGKYQEGTLRGTDTVPHPVMYANYFR
jgi:hypothetical protein